MPRISEKITMQNGFYAEREWKHITIKLNHILKEKFVEVFKKLKTKETSIEIQSAIVNQKEGYLLKINDMELYFQKYIKLINFGTKYFIILL